MKNELKYLLPICGCLWLAAACNSGPVPESESPDPLPITLSMTRGGEGETKEARLLFFTEEELGKVGASNGNAVPLLDVVPDGKINDYTTVKYNTQHLYPQDNARVYAIGISPTTLTMTDNYQSYTFPSEKKGKVDVLGTETLSGSWSSPFNGVLEFRHLTTRISFKAQRSASMQGKLFVKLLQMTICGNQVCTGMKWNAESKKYEAATAENGNDLTLEYGEQLRTDNAVEIGTAYLVLTSPEDFKGLKIIADLAKNIEFTEGSQQKHEFRIDSCEFTDTEGNPVTSINPGESYEVLVLFDQDKFELHGKEEDWNPGGQISIPIVNPK